MKRFFLVTQTFPPAMGGMQFVMHALARLLTQYGCVNVYPDARCNSEDYRVYCVPVMKLMRSAVKRWRLAWHLSSDDVVICDSWKSLQALPRFSGTVVVFAHGQEYLIKHEKKRERVRRLLARATHVIASSQATLQLVEAVVDLSNIKATVIPPTYGLSGLPKCKQMITGKRQLLSICRLEERKGLHLVMDALSEIGGLVDYKWQIVGDGAYRPVLQEKIDVLGLGSHVCILGAVSEEEKHRLYLQADLFVMPSYQVERSLEGFGIAYIEAARYGLASIAGISGGVKDAVIDQFTGWCVDPCDPAALQKILHQALFDQELCLQYGYNAQQYYLEHLCADKVFSKFIEHIEQSSSSEMVF